MTSNIFKQIGASNHTDVERQKEDYYATDPKAIELLLEQETFSDNIWECACGEKHLSRVLEAAGYKVRSSDIVDRCGNEVFDFLWLNNTKWNGDIITNPPFSLAIEFIDKALSIIPKWNKVAMFLKIQFLEGKGRREFFNNAPPYRIYVFSSRISCAINGEFDKLKHSSAVAYAWFVWKKGYKGRPEIAWI